MKVHQITTSPSSRRVQVQVDGEVTAKVLDALRGAEGIIQAGVVSLNGV